MTKEQEDQLLGDPKPAQSYAPISARAKRVALDLNTRAANEETILSLTTVERIIQTALNDADMEARNCLYSTSEDISAERVTVNTETTAMLKLSAR